MCYKCQHQLLIDIRYSFGVPYSHGYHHLYHLYFFPASCANASTGITRCRMRKCKLDGTDTRVWPGHSRVTPGRFPPSVLELRHAASLADNWFRARRDEMRVSVRWKREREGGISVTFAYEPSELKSFHRRNNLPRARRSCGLRRKGTKAAVVATRTRSWAPPEGSNCCLENSSRCILRRTEWEL